MTQVLDRKGLAAVYNLEGGLDAYSFVDGAVPRYSLTASSTRR